MESFSSLLEKYTFVHDTKVEIKEGFNFQAAKSRLQSSEKTVVLKRIRDMAWLLDGDKSKKLEILCLLYKDKLENNDLEKVKQLSSGLRITKKETLQLGIPAIPIDVRDDVAADIREIEKTFSSGCYRASTILCGRILETCLHRKYYDATGQDILEKNPGIGLGKLIAKLNEKNVEMDPGLTQQIHLINQVRIFSVHKKKQTFSPSKVQTSAIILYTMDVIGKMF